VPSLAELRVKAGLPAHYVAAKLLIENMFAQGELPTRRSCARCSGAADATVIITAECEKSWGHDPSPFIWLSALLFTGIWPLLLLFQLQREGRERGDNLILHLPIRMCQSCRRQLPGTAVAWILRVAAFVLIAASILLILLWTGWGALLALGLVVVVAAGRAATIWQQAVMRHLLRNEPLYVELLMDYPDTKLLLSPDARHAGPGAAAARPRD
jgi:hypothetical protein